MNHAELLKKYLANRNDVDVADHGYPFVTISRQPGAGGHTLGREIIRHLDNRPEGGWMQGWDLFDQKLCAYLAQDPSTQASFETLLKEEFQEGVQESVYEMFIGRAEQYLLQKRIAEVVRFLAFIGRVVIIGRAGMCATRHLRAGVHIRLVAPEEVRLRRMMEMMETGPDEALREMRKQEKDRARLIRSFYNEDICNPLLYDMILNTDRIDNETMAKMVVDAVVVRRQQTLPQRKLRARRAAGSEQ